MRLETRALHWLLYAHGSHFAVCERSTREWWCVQPDALGITKGRRLTEIEIKRSVSDFRANRRKRHIINRDSYLEKAPFKFYFLVPKELTAKILPELPEWAGLLDDSAMFINIVKEAPANIRHQRLTVKECAKLMRNLSNHIAGIEQALDFHIEHQESDCGIEYRI